MSNAREAIARRRTETATHALAPPDGAVTDYERLFLENLPYVEHVVAFIVRRHALNSWDADDFDGWVKLRLIQGDYAILRKFKGSSRLTTFLTTVIHNLHRDFRIQRWGKWRPSAAARRHGELGIQLETLLYRDGYSLAEAVRILRENYSVEIGGGELASVAAELRPRFSRRFESEEALIDAAAPDRTERRLESREKAASWYRLLRRVREAMLALDGEERLILRLRFEEGLTVAAIARELDLDQRRLYTRVHALLRQLRQQIGVAAAQPARPVLQLASSRG